MKNTIKWFGLIALVAVIGLSVAACSNGSLPSIPGLEDDPGTGGDTVTGITLNPPSLTLTVGGTAALTATVLPANAANKSVNWSSVNPGVAAVDSNGTVIGIAVGSATIIAVTTDGGKFATCDVTVSAEAAPVTGISLDKTSLSLLMGVSDILTASVAPADASNKAVNWTSTNPNVAMIDSNGTVAALSLGLAIIVATTEDGGKVATCAVSVIEEAAAGAIAVTGVSISPTTLSLEAGQRRNLSASVQPANATNKAVNWQSSNPAIAEVDANGNVTAKGPGTATIYVSTAEGGRQASCMVTISGGPPTSVFLTPPTLTLETGKTGNLFVTVLPADARNKAVTWTSDNPAVAAVDANGNITAKTLGTATIYVSTVEGGLSASAVVTVSGGAPSSVEIFPPTLSLRIGETYKLDTTVKPDNATNKAVTWTSDNPAVATVDDNGNVTAKERGTATIYVRTVEGGNQASCVVTVNGTPAPSINRYQAIPRSDRIIYSYTYENLDFYYIYMGELANIPIYSEDAYEHDGRDMEYTFTKTKKDETTIRTKVSTSIEEVIGIIEEHTETRTDGGTNNWGWGVGGKITIKKAVELGGGYKKNGETYWSDYTSDSTNTMFQETKSLTKTEDYSTTNAHSSQNSFTYHFTQYDPVGYYRWSYVTSSDVYLYIIRDSRTGQLYGEFKEHIIENPKYVYKFDYSEISSFRKNDGTGFEIDMSILESLPKPKLAFGLNAQLADLKTKAVSGGKYILEVVDNEIIEPHTFSFPGMSNITITFTGIGEERTLSLSSTGSMFTVDSGVTLVLDNNIKLQGRSGNTGSLVRVNSDGALVMNAGSTISGNSFSGNTTSANGSGGGVRVGGTFTMNGGTISDNTTSVNGSGGGVYVSVGSFTMNGGTISDNTASANGSGGGVYVDYSSGTFTMNGGIIFGNTSSRGGGVGVYDGTFIMSGGTISGNTANYDGGGVYIRGTFTKTGGTIYGYTARDPNSNVAEYSSGIVGHAVYATDLTITKRRETTAGPTVNLWFNSATDPRQSSTFSGAWDY